MSPMSPSEALVQLEQQRQSLVSELGAVGDLRPGSLTRRFRRCGKTNCHCAKSDSPGHGPLWSLTWAVHGQTHSRVIPAGTAVERTKEQIAEYHRFQELVRRFIATSERLCEAKLHAAVQTSEATEEKKGSTAHSRRRSSKRSKSS